LFSTSSIYIAKKRTNNKHGNQIKARAGAGAVDWKRLALFCASFLSYVSFAHSCPLFSTSSIYIAKKRTRADAYLPATGGPANNTGFKMATVTR
jgi:hypothetical protein